MHIYIHGSERARVCDYCRMHAVAAYKIYLRHRSWIGRARARDCTNAGRKAWTSAYAGDSTYFSGRFAI